MLPREIQFVRTRAPAVAAELRLKARRRIAHYVHLANDKLGIALPMPTCSFDLRGRTAGMAYPGKNHVRLNAVLLTENEAHFMEDTIPHEVAHLAAQAKYGQRIRPHGPEWQRTMRTLGVTPTRTHSLDVRNSAVGPAVDFRCRCPGSRTLYGRRARQGLAGKLFCKRCKQDLVAIRTDPVRPAKPPSEPQDAPLPAAVDYARTLAARLGRQVPVAAETDRKLLSEFVTQAMMALAQSPHTPTACQLDYAQALAKRLGIQVPAQALASREAMSSWIGEQAIAARTGKA